MGTRCIANECLGTTGFSYTLSLINGKYKMIILYTLMEFGVVRFNEMKKYIGGISYKTLSATLKELEADKLVHRRDVRVGRSTQTVGHSHKSSQQKHQDRDADKAGQGA